MQPRQASPTALKGHGL